MVQSSSRWMASLVDETPMTTVSIPGTHDSCCYDLTGVTAQLWDSKWRPLFVTAALLPLGGLIGLTAAEYVVRVLALTQTLSIPQQLAAGVRFFDLRPSFAEGSTLPIYHGIVRTKSTLPDVLNQVTQFLNENPSEYVVLRLKAENDNIERSQRKEILAQCLMPYQNHISKQRSSNAIAVGSIRGKIVLLTQDIQLLDEPLHTEDWWSAKIQDEYEINANENFISTIAEGACAVFTAPARAVLSFLGEKTSNWCENAGKKVPKIFVPDKVFDVKRDAIKDHHALSIARSGGSLSNFSINFVSCVGSGSDVLFLSPQVCAGKLNPGISDLISKSGNGEKTGIVVMDFITEDLAKSIYLSNKLST